MMKNSSCKAAANPEVKRTKGTLNKGCSDNAADGGISSFL